MSEHPFQFTYNAQMRKEVELIRSKYINKDENKLDRLKRLDQGATNKATTGALIAGITGTLLLGTGMSLFMTPLGSSLGSTLAFALGLVLGTIGIAGIVLAHPLYRRILKREREKIAPEVLLLTEELLK